MLQGFFAHKVDVGFDSFFGGLVEIAEPGGERRNFARMDAKGIV